MPCREEVSEAFKEQGNAIYSEKQWEAAAVWYSLAVAVDPCNWKALSNRANCHAQVRPHALAFAVSH